MSSRIDRTAAPNFIHSRDAAHLAMTATEMAQRGVRHFTFIHDSFGVPSGAAEILFTVLRDVFYTLYAGDVLKDLEGFIKDMHRRWSCLLAQNQDYLMSAKRLTK